MSSNYKIQRSEPMNLHESLKTLLSAIPYELGLQVEVSLDSKNDSITLLIFALPGVTSIAHSMQPLEILVGRTGRS